MYKNGHIGNLIQQLILFLFVCGWKLAVIRGINITVSEFTGISWDQAWEECNMRNVRLPNASLDLTAELLPEGYNTTPVWVDVSYVNKTQPVSSLQELLQKTFKCLAVSKMDGEFLYRLDSCSTLNRFLCGNPPTAELYPSNLYSWIGAQEQCRLQHNQISNMAESEAETYMTKGAWYWVFDVRKLTFQPDHAVAKDGCGYVQDGKVKFTNCSDRVPTTLCIGEPIDRVRQEDNYTEDSNDLKVILIAVFVSLGIVCAIILAVITFIKRNQQGNKSKNKIVTASKRKFEPNVLNIQANTATPNGRTVSSDSLSQPADSTAIPEQNGRKTVLVMSSASENHRHNNGQYLSLKIDYDDVTSYIPQGNDNSRDSSVASIVNAPVEYATPNKVARYRTAVKTLPFEDSGVYEEYEKSRTFKQAIPMEGSCTKSRHDKANLPNLKYEDYSTTYDARRHRVFPHYESFV